MPRKKTNYTPAMREWLAAHVAGRDFATLTAMFNERFGTSVSVHTLNNFCWKHGLSNGWRGQHPYTREQYDWIRDNVAGRLYDELAAMFNARFGANVSGGALKNLCSRSGLSNGMKGRCEACRRNHFRTGALPWNTGTKGAVKPNSGSFKPGHNLHAKPVGTLIERKGDVFVKTAQPNVWRRVGHAIVERERDAPLPQGSIVLYADGDKSNLSPDNLLVMSRPEHGYMHKAGLKFADAELTKAGLALAKLQLKLGERRKEEKA